MISTEICRRGQCMANRKKPRAENVTKEKKPGQNSSNRSGDNEQHDIGIFIVSRQ